MPTIPYCRNLNTMPRFALEDYAFGMELSLRTLARLVDVLQEECRHKHCLDPFEDNVNPDYHAEVTLTIREIRDAVQAVRQGDTPPVLEGHRSEVDPRNNPPAGYRYACMASPQFDRSSGRCTWRNGLGQCVEVRGGVLIPRDADADGTCYLFLPALHSPDRSDPPDPSDPPPP